MKILLTGGGSGGHFYPVLAVGKAIRELSIKNGGNVPTLYFMAPDPYDIEILKQNNLIFIKSPAGKLRLYFSFKNVIDILKTGIGILKSLWVLFRIYPDVMFGKGGYGSFTTMVAGRILGIPIIIHESDAVPGRVNSWAGKFAKRIAVSYKETKEFFPKDKVFLSGQPIRDELFDLSNEVKTDFLKLEEGVPIIFVIGGSLGAQVINNVILSILPELVFKYQIIHQTGEANLKDVNSRIETILGDNPYRNRYKPFGYLDLNSLKAIYSKSKLIISRAGSTIFEIAGWGIPSIIIPITDSQGDHQRKNAFIYSKTGACVVIEEANLTSKILSLQIENLMTDNEKLKTMSESAKQFVNIDSSKIIANEILNLAKHIN